MSKPTEVDGTEQRHAIIWLQPWCDGCERHNHNLESGRCWCQDELEPCAECGRVPVKYVIDQAR